MFMPISRLSLPEGEPLPKELSNLHLVAANIILNNLSEVKLVDPGEYDLTPRIWTKNVFNHELTVFDDGTGLYRILPKSDDAGAIEATKKSISSFEKGGRQYFINDNHPLAVVAGNHPVKQEPTIFEIIIHL
jgi:hypothetical protein